MFELPPGPAERDVPNSKSISDDDLLGIASLVRRRAFRKMKVHRGVLTFGYVLMILPQVHLRKPCYDFYFL